VLRAIVFDFDGVIANSEPLHFAAFHDVLAVRGVELNKADYYGRYLGYDDVGVFRAVASDHHLAWTRDHVADLTRAKAARLAQLEGETSVLFPGAEAVIRRAAARVPLAIASGALGVEIRRALDHADLTSSFRAIVAAGETPAGKPEPDPYARALTLLSERLGTAFPPESCVAIEDSKWGLASAKAAGLRTVGVLHTYGRDELDTADLIIRSLDDLDLEALDRLCPG
jgi:HAD superfamily hydrolase (TIGR01509 family)